MSLVDKITPKQRKLLLILADSIVTVFTLYISFLIIQAPMLTGHKWLFPLFILIRIIAFKNYGVYMFLWRYASIKETVILAKAITLSSLLIMSSLFITKSIDFPESILFIEWALAIIFIGGSRICLRLYRDYIVSISIKKIKKEDQVKVLIIGAGDAGAMIAREIQKVASLKYNIVGFIDDEETKLGQYIHQIPVLGTTKEVSDIVVKNNIKEAIIAIPSANGKAIRNIMELCERTKIKFKTTPGLYDIIGGKVSVNQLREVRIEDLLGRKVVQTDLSSISKYLSNSIVLLTGAGGSIGSELCRQIYQFNPKTLLILDNSENAIYNINMEMIKKNINPDKIKIVPIIADVKNQLHLRKIFSKYKPDVVFHAAAYKHVPLMEENTAAAVENNIVGTNNMISLTHEFKAKEFVLISTDKAVYPKNNMGASKRICEVLMQIQAKQSKTKFTAVRFGNVLGSQGSVVPLFKQQISEGGPITLTHKDMTRFFMTIPEAVRLVIQTGALSKGGEIFVLDMGEPVKILNLAKDLIHLSGLEEGKDVEIKFIGLRPGEKLNEVLFFNKESLKSTEHNKIFVAKPFNYNTNAIKTDIDELIIFSKNSINSEIRKKLFSIINKTQPKEN